MQPPVTLVKASAGSGKTYRLTKEYVNLLLAGDPADVQRFKHILAVTFTNKATDEMKERIVKRLEERANDLGDPLHKKARACLSAILFDYSSFSVSTIDRFFQTVLRAFAREIDQYLSYRVEVDNETVLLQVVDLLLDSLGEPDKEALHQWLRRYAVGLAEQGQSWSLRAPLLKMAEEFMGENFRRQAMLMGDDFGKREEIATLQQQLKTICESFENTVKQAGKRILELLSEVQVKPTSLTAGKKKPFTVVNAWAKGTMSVPAPYILEGLERHNLPEIKRLTEDVCQLFATEYRAYTTARAVLDDIHLLGIYSDLLKQLQSYLQENNLMLLARSTELLNGIIGDEDTPFVYEKIGNRFDHLMLDEAQDTSRMQWDNFQPLFKNSAAKGFSSLVVGDIKQSIYRWRGGDWRLLDQYLFDDLGSSFVRNDPLKENWRSGAALVNFNCTFFSAIGDLLAKESQLKGVSEEVKNIYASCHQSIPQQRQTEPQGYLHIAFLSSDAKPWKEQALERSLEDIHSLKDEGYDYKDITVLVRKKEDGAEVARFLMSQGISVITQDSLLLGSSPLIQRIIALLTLQVNPQDPVNLELARQFGIDVQHAAQGSIYEVCEQLLSLPGLHPSSTDIPFIHAFLDGVLSWQNTYGSSLRDFIRWWEEKGAETPISAPDGQNAVRIMTIHKSKGLDLEAVIIPFVDDKVFRYAPTIWCRTNLKPYDKVGLIPLTGSQALLDTYFADEFLKEQTLQYVDLVNTWYVAFTRACSRLFIYTEQPHLPQKSKYDIGYNASYFQSFFYLFFLSQQGGFALDENQSFSMGKREPFTSKEKKRTMEDDLQSSFKREPLNDRLKLTLHGDDYFAQEKSARQLGIEKHRDMASVEVDAMLEAQSGHRHWFDGTYRVMNEASIVDSKGEIKRPDRVLIAPDGSRVIVIDYKFGQPLDGYKYQVRAYVRLLKEMGYPSVEGWLWYVSSGEIVRV